MATGRHVIISSAIALLAAMVTLFSATPARAGCNFDDILNAVENTVGSIISDSCPTVCADPVTCAAVVATDVVLGAVSAQASQSAVNDFCSEVSSLLSEANSKVDNANTVINALQKVLGTSGGDLLSQLSSAVSSIADPLGIAQCACGLDQGIGQLGADLGACIQDAFCAIDTDLFGDPPCTCTPPPPVVANCSASNQDCGSWFSNNPACLAGPNSGLMATGGQNGCCASEYQNASGTFVTTPASNEGATCFPATYCFCPAPMTPVWTEDLPWIVNYGYQATGPQVYIFSCACPKGTHADPSGATVNGISVCLCNGTNTKANFGQNLGGMCPPPNCPAGKTRLAANGPCVEVCKNKADGMTLDGACCNPAQMTTCGICCPPGTTPDPTSGTCDPPFQPK